ncbi:F-box domain, Leucine-rich repeat domain, L domain-like protein [Artemisia annua]|uniref:F-box domain, Leucine-rich repeat domain, L domain-like protein n=1 Tax=Artemisia annua TaxID=35608 RepID=A0A2U1NVX7_ARTAN|nr:F-box domain, Leucine-rich repeat domain, L domain-like protein [Artemisia annua]
MEENITDRISELPGFIIHHILSYLDSPKELVRMSVLSNYWFELTASFPILDFSIYRFEKVIESSGIPIDTEKDTRDMFFKYVEYTVSRFCEQNVSVHTFKLVTFFPDPSDVEIIDRCLGLILEKGVKVLVIDVLQHRQMYRVPNILLSAYLLTSMKLRKYPSDVEIIDRCLGLILEKGVKVLVIDVLQHRQMYRVPNILLSAYLLTSMKLRKCELPSSLLVDVVRFKSLKVLHLDAVPLNEEMIKRLTTSCSLLEELVVKYCCGLKNFCVYGLLHLQQIEIWFKSEVERIEIDAPKLWGATVMQKRNESVYHGHVKELANLLSKFPILEDLFLDLPKKYKKLTLSSHSLRTIMLRSKCDLGKLDIDASNLLLFGFTDYSHFYFHNEMIIAPSKACMEWDRDDFISGQWFQKLRQFLDKKIRFRDLKLRICVGCLDNIRSEVIQWPPVELEHVELELEYFQYASYYEFVVDCILWCCRPQSLALIIDFSLLERREWDMVVKYTYEKLLQQEDQVHTNIHFVMPSSSSNAKMKFSDLSTLLTALPRDGSEQTITFIKKEVVQETKQDDETAKVCKSISEDGNVAIIDKCLGLILENGIKVLVIDMHNWTYRLQHPQMYHVPNIFLSAPSLASLKLCYCEIPSSFMVDVVKFKSLKLLHLECVRLNEEVITSFTTNCPLLEEFIVIYCYGLKRFCVYEHLNLRQVKIRFIPEFDRIDIDAPNLCFLCLHCKYDERGVSPSMNLASCKKLTKVCYHGERLVDLSHNFPFLEDLFLDLPKKCKRLTLSSHSLRTFMLNSECDLGKIDVNAPNLLLFGFTDNLHFHSPMGSFSIPSKPCMEWDRNTLVEDNWFKKLRQFLDKKLRFKELKLHINVGCLDFTKPEVILWPPLEFEHVELEAKEFESVDFYLDAVYSLLWRCRPQSLTLIIDFSLLEFEEWESVVEYTYEKLLEQEDQVHTNINLLMASSTSNAKLNFGDLSTLLTALPRDGSKQKNHFH